MSGPYKVTLVHLKANALGLAPAGEKIELGYISAEEIYQLAGNFLLLSNVADFKDEPGIIVHRGENGWRLAVHTGRLCLHKSTSLFDEYWTVENARGLGELPPFLTDRPAVRAAPRMVGTANEKFGGLRAIGEVVGLFALGVGLIVVGFWFGLPHKKLSDLPDGVTVVTSSSEKSSIFSLVAGSYATGQRPGDSIVTITTDGRVTIGAFGRDGKPTKPRIEAQARAARKGSLAAVVVPSVGVISEMPPDAVIVGYGNTSWKRLVN
jgi:hypothetical protein